MGTMTLTITLSEDIGTALKNKARTSGKDLSEYIETLLVTQVERPSFDDILAPVRKGFADTGDSEDEILAFFEKTREEVYQEGITVK